MSNNDELFAAFLNFLELKDNKIAPSRIKIQINMDMSNEELQNFYLELLLSFLYDLYSIMDFGSMSSHMEEYKQLIYKSISQLPINSGSKHKDITSNFIKIINKDPQYVYNNLKSIFDEHKDDSVYDESGKIKALSLKIYNRYK